MRLLRNQAVVLAGTIAISSALLGVTGTASAAGGGSSVTLYGVVDTGLIYVSNRSANGNSSLGLSDGFTLPSRWGVRGSEELAPGYKAGFRLESGFDSTTGSSSQGGRLFGRQAHIYLETPVGEFQFGRVYSRMQSGLWNSDLLGPNLFGLGSLDLYITSLRNDNAISYATTVDGFTFGATYSFGRDAVDAPGLSPFGQNCPQVTGDSKACRSYSANLKYDAQNWGVGVAYDRANGGPNVDAPWDFTNFPSIQNSRDYHETRSLISGWAKIEKATLGAGVVRLHNESAASFKRNLWFVEARYPIAPRWTVEGAVFISDRLGSKKDSQMFVARVTHELSRRTQLLGYVGYLINDGGAANSLDAKGATPGKNQTGFGLGIRHFF